MVHFLLLTLLCLVLLFLLFLFLCNMLHMFQLSLSYLIVVLEFGNCMSMLRCFQFQFFHLLLLNMILLLQSFLVFLSNCYLDLLDRLLLLYLLSSKLFVWSYRFLVRCLMSLVLFGLFLALGFLLLICFLQRLFFLRYVRRLILRLCCLLALISSLHYVHHWMLELCLFWFLDLLTSMLRRFYSLKSFVHLRIPLALLHLVLLQFFLGLLLTCMMMGLTSFASCLLLHIVLHLRCSSSLRLILLLMLNTCLVLCLSLVLRLFRCLNHPLCILIGFLQVLL